MKFSAYALLALLPLQAASAFKSTFQIPTKQTSSLHMTNQGKTAFETVLEFNTQFKQGLKYVLVPQSANKVDPGSYYDSVSIPDLEAPPGFLVSSSSSLDSTVNQGKTAFDTVLEFNAQFKQGLKYVLVPQSANKVAPGSYYDSASIPDLDAPPEFLASSSNGLDSTVNAAFESMARDAENALQAAKDVASSSFEISSNPVDPVFDKTMAQLIDALKHPPNLQDFIPNGAPPGEGLATPFLDYVTNTLNYVRDVPPLVDVPELPQDYQTIKYGFQVKTTALDTLQAGRIQSEKFGSWMLENAEQGYANSAVVSEQIKTRLLDNYEHMSERSAVIAEQMSANTATFAHQISDNAAAIQSSMQHMKDVDVPVFGSWMVESANNAPVREQIKSALLANVEHMSETRAAIAEQMSANTRRLSRTR
jgi:hypothetical protein